ncbi:MAG: IDEAL domain-containing protein [Solibacillus sp.]|uniref:IDEAL domain-containing protein n=1 Tax=unclassified Solibacillus TaxID=2637870 RepID=UPI003100D35F
MIQVQFMKPFYTKLSGEKLRLVFAYQYFSITKDDEIFHFIPIEGKEMIVDLNTMQVENLSEVFVFQRGNRFVRLPLYQLLLVSNVHEYLMPIIENVSTHVKLPQAEAVYEFDAEVEGIVRVLEAENLDRLIDDALEARNEALFHDLMAEKAKFTGGYAAS